MGRFDALTQLEENKKTSTPLPDISSPTSQKPQNQQVEKKETKKKKPEIMKSGIHENVSPTGNGKEKPIKYSTLLDPALIKKIKLVAAETDVKDYEVIEQALTEYFKTQS